LWQFGHSQSLSRPAPAGFFWEPSSEYEPALVPIAPGLGGIKPYLSMGIPYIPPINGTVNEISLVTFE